MTVTHEGPGLKFLLAIRAMMTRDGHERFGRRVMREYVLKKLVEHGSQENLAEATGITRKTLREGLVVLGIEGTAERAGEKFQKAVRAAGYTSPRAFFMANGGRSVRALARILNLAPDTVRPHHAAFIQETEQ